MLEVPGKIYYHFWEKKLSFVVWVKDRNIWVRESSIEGSKVTKLLPGIVVKS